MAGWQRLYVVLGAGEGRSGIRVRGKVWSKVRGFWGEHSLECNYTTELLSAEVVFLLSRRLWRSCKIIELFSRKIYYSGENGDVIGESY